MFSIPRSLSIFWFPFLDLCLPFVFHSLIIVYLLFSFVDHRLPFVYSFVNPFLNHCFPFCFPFVNHSLPFVVRFWIIVYLLFSIDWSSFTLRFPFVDHRLPFVSSPLLRYVSHLISSFSVHVEVSFLDCERSWRSREVRVEVTGEYVYVRKKEQRMTFNKNSARKQLSSFAIDFRWDNLSFIVLYLIVNAIIYNDLVVCIDG